PDERRSLLGSGRHRYSAGARRAAELGGEPAGGAVGPQGRRGAEMTQAGTMPAAAAAAATDRPTQPALVEMQDISKAFGAVRALTHVNLTIAPAEVLGLVGDNAAGKSTLMKILAGAIQPDSGRI